MSQTAHSWRANLRANKLANDEWFCQIDMTTATIEAASIMATTKAADTEAGRGHTCRGRHESWRNLGGRRISRRRATRIISVSAVASSPCRPSQWLGLAVEIRGCISVAEITTTTPPTCVMRAPASARRGSQQMRLGWPNSRRKQVDAGASSRCQRGLASPSSQRPRLVRPNR